MKAIKVVFFGTPLFTSTTLEALITNPNFDLKAIITQPDKHVGRKKTLVATEIKQFYLDLYASKNIDILQPYNINKDLEFIEKLKSFDADFFVVFAFGQLFSTKILEIPKFGCVNIHPSLLPKYRGASPIISSILAGDSITGVSIMQMGKGMDSGDLWAQKQVKILENENSESLSKRLSEISTQLLINTLPRIITKDIVSIPQNNAEASYCKKFESQDGKINFEQETAKDIYNKIRAFDKWPSCYCIWKNKKLKLIQASFSTNQFDKNLGETIYSNDSLYISAKNGSIKIEKLQLEGKNITNISDFLRGYPDFKETKLN